MAGSTEREFRRPRLPLEWALEPIIHSAHAVGSTALAAQRVEHRLAAIFAAEVPGRGRLVGAGEEEAFARLKAHRRELIDRKIAEHKGRAMKATRDGMLVEFPSVVDAVRCAVEGERAIVACNAENPEDQGHRR